MIAGDMKLVDAIEADISHLMSWFPTERSIDIWAGPGFRYPLTPETFQEDIRWRQMDSYCLVSPQREVLAFGQIYDRHGRINLARLVVSPDRRGQGIGKQLVALLMKKGRDSFPLREYSLFVYKDNYPAKACYAGLGFEEHEYPRDDEMADSCIYMTRPVSLQANP
jgi:ribosomal protein S18 acetylase RimI-like enzyme